MNEFMNCRNVHEKWIVKAMTSDPRMTLQAAIKAGSGFVYLVQKKKNSAEQLLSKEIKFII